MNYEWDDRKAVSNVVKHGIDFADATTALEDDHALTIIDDSSDEERMVTVGTDALGRLPVVVYTWRGIDTIRLISPRRATSAERKRYQGQHMKDEYDFGGAKRGAVVPTSDGTTQITLRIDDDILEWFRRDLHEAGGGNYLSRINAALRAYMETQDEPLEDTLRRVIREELRNAA